MLILEKNIPMLEKHGFKKALATEYYMLGILYYYEIGNYEKGDEALSKAKALLAHFGGISAIKGASLEELCTVKGISKKDAESIINYYHNGV